MNRIQEQANKFWQTILSAETLDTYQAAGAVTWNILRELAILVWLVICLGLVGFDWFWKNSIQAGRNFRSWLSNMDGSSPDRVASEAGKALLSVGKGSLTFTLSQAREQLGLPSQPDRSEGEAAAASKSSEPKKVPSPASSSLTVSPPSPAPVLSAPSTSSASAQVAEPEEDEIEDAG